MTRVTRRQFARRPWLSPLKSRQNALRENADFVRPIKAIWVIQSSRQKYSASPLPQITLTTPRIPHPQEGRIAIVTDVGCGMRWTRQRRAREVVAGRIFREQSTGAQTTGA